MSNGNANLMDEFEEAFQHCLHVLTKQDRQPYDDDVIKLEVEQTTMNFINLARQIEVFFLQKRFLLSTLKPELLLIEENYDLKHELQRKEELIKKHYDKIEYWKKILSDQPAKPTMPANVPPPVGAIPPVGPSGQLNPNMHMQQQIQMQQQQQQQMVQQHAAAAAAQQQRMMMNQNLYMSQQHAGATAGGSGGPLSYLEKSTDMLPSGGGER